MSEVKKIFTVEELNKLIPKLSEMMVDIMEKRETYNRRHDVAFMHELLTDAEKSANESSSLSQELENDFLSLEEDLVTLKADVQKLVEMGCVSADLENGFLDFPGNRQGEAIYFSWKYGESQISYFRHVKSKVSDRKLLS
jgi:hypothetical protein